MKAARSNACLPSEAAPASGMALPAQPAHQASHSYLARAGWSGRDQEIHHPPSHPAGPLPVCHSHPNTLQHAQGSDSRSHLSASQQVPWQHLCTLEPLHPGMEDGTGHLHEPRRVV